MTSPQKLTLEESTVKEKRTRSGRYFLADTVRKKRGAILLSDLEYEEVNRRAKEYCNGEIAAWIRFATLKMTPMVDEIEVFKARIDFHRKFVNY